MDGGLAGHLLTYHLPYGPTNQALDLFTCFRDQCAAYLVFSCALLLSFHTARDINQKDDIFISSLQAVIVR